jgi:hypothetical protein
MRDWRQELTAHHRREPDSGGALRRVRIEAGANRIDHRERRVVLEAIVVRDFRPRGATDEQTTRKHRGGTHIVLRCRRRHAECTSQREPTAGWPGSQRQGINGAVSNAVSMQPGQAVEHAADRLSHIELVDRARQFQRRGMHEL